MPPVMVPLFLTMGRYCKKGAVRATNGIYKTVYLGYGLEMVGSTAIKNEIINALTIGLIT
jgi:hypothetical protein